MTEREYSLLVQDFTPKSRLKHDCIYAFTVGGAICTLGQSFCEFYQLLGIPQSSALLWASCTLILVSALFTGLGVYDDLAAIAGAGTLVPITGFSNAVTASAVEFQTEGFITGVGAKMFTIAGPVIVYGTAASVVYGIIYWIAIM